MQSGKNKALVSLTILVTLALGLSPAQAGPPIQETVDSISETCGETVEGLVSTIDVQTPAQADRILTKLLSTLQQYGNPLAQCRSEGNSSCMEGENAVAGDGNPNPYVACVAGGGYLQEATGCAGTQDQHGTGMYNYAWGDGQAYDSGGLTRVWVHAADGERLLECSFDATPGDWAGCSEGHGHYHRHACGSEFTHNIDVSVASDEYGTLTDAFTYTGYVPCPE